MKKLVLFLTLCVPFCISAQEGVDTSIYNEVRWTSIITSEIPDGTRMSAGLHQLATLALVDRDEAVLRLHNSKYRWRATDDRLNIEVVFRNVENLERITDRIDGEYLRGLGFDVDATWKNRASIWIALEDVLAKAEKLPSDYFIFPVDIPYNDDEGPGVMNSTGYKTGSGPGGAGLRIAVFDGGFTSLQSVINAGNMKTPAYVGIGGTASTIAGVNFSNSQHGTAVAETVYDHCPDADIEIYANGNITDKGNAVDDCITNGVDVIVMSQSHYNTGWADNSGGACAFAQDAANAGILFVTSCGNRAESHYEATFTDADSDNWHEWSGTDEQNNRIGNLPNGEDFGVTLSWNTAVSADYDLYLYRASDNTVLASSTLTGTTVNQFESCSWTNNTGVSVNIYIAVRKKNSSQPNTQFEIFTHNDGSYQYATAAGSNTSPSNTTNSNVISVGAVSWVDYDDSSGAAGAIMDYSSRGPTNSGNLAPKITGPTNTETDIYNGNFGGTSCATPNVGGALLSFWSSQPSLDATGVRQIAFRKAHLYKDWGAAGVDNTYGNGGLRLYDYASTNRYMMRGNPSVTNATRPYHTLAIAEQLAPNNATVIILNSGSYVETGIYGVTGTGANKRILYRSPFSGVNAEFGY